MNAAETLKRKTDDTTIQTKMTISSTFMWLKRIKTQLAPCVIPLHFLLQLEQEVMHSAFPVMQYQWDTSLLLETTVVGKALYAFVVHQPHYSLIIIHITKTSKQV